MTRYLFLVSLVALHGCGAETLGTAAVGASTQIDAARQAEETKANVQNQIQAQMDAATRLERQKLEQAEAAGKP
jgi:hypothetical protein